MERYKFTQSFSVFLFVYLFLMIAEAMVHILLCLFHSFNASFIYNYLMCAHVCIVLILLCTSHRTIMRYIICFSNNHVYLIYMYYYIPVFASNIFWVLTTKTKDNLNICQIYLIFIKTDGTVDHGFHPLSGQSEVMKT